MSGSEFIPYFPGNVTNKSINPLVSNVGDFTAFYVAIAICTLIFGSILILNIVCCCSRYSDYWLDRHTGNRWLVSIWSATPYKQPPLDLTELESNWQQVEYLHQFKDNSEEYSGLPKQNIPQNISQQPLTSGQENLELHKQESDI